MPEGCGNPFQDTAAFREFYEASISYMAARLGPGAKGVVDLWAVNEMRSEMDLAFPNMAEESPLDRLIVAQICTFYKVRLGDPVNKSRFGVKIESSDAQLHEHLSNVASRLYKDSRNLLIQALAERARHRQKENLIASRMSDVRRAREEGRKKIRDLFR